MPPKRSGRSARVPSTSSTISASGRRMSKPGEHARDHSPQQHMAWGFQHTLDQSLRDDGFLYEARNDLECDRCARRGHSCYIKPLRSHARFTKRLIWKGCKGCSNRPQGCSHGTLGRSSFYWKSEGDRLVRVDKSQAESDKVASEVTSPTENDSLYALNELSSLSPLDTVSPTQAPLDLGHTSFFTESSTFQSGSSAAWTPTPLGDHTTGRHSIIVPQSDNTFSPFALPDLEGGPSYSTTPSTPFSIPTPHEPSDTLGWKDKLALFIIEKGLEAVHTNEGIVDEFRIRYGVTQGPDDIAAAVQVEGDRLFSMVGIYARQEFDKDEVFGVEIYNGTFEMENRNDAFEVERHSAAFQDENYNNACKVENPHPNFFHM